jgi:hypothetical protein
LELHILPIQAVFIGCVNEVEDGGVSMKTYTVILVQLILWSGYTFMEWLSKHDQPIYNVLMFLVFFYLAIIAGNFIMKSAKKTFLITLVSLALYSTFQIAMQLISTFMFIAFLDSST